MENHWATYLCTVNRELASILLDVALVNSPEARRKGELLWVWVYMISSRSDGLSSDKEVPFLYRMEDALSSALAVSCSAVFAGRITTLARREFYFYADGAAGFEESVAKVLSQYPEYRFDLGHQTDPEWRQYQDVLYPTPEQFQSIANREVLDVLRRDGDDHAIARRVQHWAFFPSEDQRSGFHNAAIGADFLFDSEFNVETETPFAISVSKDQPIEPEKIDATTLILFRLCEKWGGTYDGWETLTVKSE